MSQFKQQEQLLREQVTEGMQNIANGLKPVFESLYSKESYNRHLMFQPNKSELSIAPQELDQRKQLQNQEAAKQPYHTAEPAMEEIWVRDPKNPTRFIPILVPRSVARSSKSFRP